MSLFEDDQYRWRETYFVLFNDVHRPSAERVEAALRELGSRYEISNVRRDDDGRFESITLTSPYDFAAMDISYVSGEEVQAQVGELNEQFKTMTLNSDEMRKVARLSDSNARFDVFHFEQVADDEDEMLDPGALLVVLEKLAELCQGVGVDPQSGAVM